MITAAQVGMRPVFHAMWREECMKIGIDADEFRITSGGESDMEVMNDVTRRARTDSAQIRNYLQTFPFVGMHTMTVSRLVLSKAQQRKFCVRSTITRRKIWVPHLCASTLGLLFQVLQPVVGNTHWSGQSASANGSDVGGEFHLDHDKT